jgi:putative tricarboxylic transport membrane protein
MTVQASKDGLLRQGNIKGVIARSRDQRQGLRALIPRSPSASRRAEMAVFMGILILHGMQPGPLILQQHQSRSTA